MNEPDWADTLVVNLLLCTCAGAHRFAAASHDRCPVSKRPVVAQALRDERAARIQQNHETVCTEIVNLRAQLAALNLCEPGFLDKVLQERDDLKVQLAEARAENLTLRKNWEFKVAELAELPELRDEKRILVEWIDRLKGEITEAQAMRKKAEWLIHHNTWKPFMYVRGSRVPNPHYNWTDADWIEAEKKGEE